MFIRGKADQIKQSSHYLSHVGFLSETTGLNHRTALHNLGPGLQMRRESIFICRVKVDGLFGNNNLPGVRPGWYVYCNIRRLGSLLKLDGHEIAANDQSTAKIELSSVGEEGSRMFSDLVLPTPQQAHLSWSQDLQNSERIVELPTMGGNGRRIFNGKAPLLQQTHLSWPRDLENGRRIVGRDPRSNTWS
ncbi:hypothetical protein VTL71DRAFT_9021 [Oculimacula yallundae]|uniref:Uncharacterized protein n=1 Tax=Oculimacula yallundae TaxID=86028 RepID=A0ABR4BTL5_9HELO